MCSATLGGYLSPELSMLFVMNVITPPGIECHCYSQCADDKLRHKPPLSCRGKPGQGGKLNLGVLSLSLVGFFT